MVSPALSNTPKSEIQPNKKNANDLEKVDLVEISIFINSLDIAPRQIADLEKKAEQLNSTLTEMEKLSSLSTREQHVLAWAFNRLANLYYPAQNRRNQTIGLVDVNYEKGKAYKLREINLHLRMRTDKEYTVRCHQALLNWYNDRQCVEESTEQINILSKLLDTNDLKIINPPRDSSCGGFIEDDLNAETKLRIPISIACGMG